MVVYVTRPWTLRWTPNQPTAATRAAQPKQMCQAEQICEDAGGDTGQVLEALMSRCTWPRCES